MKTILSLITITTLLVGGLAFAEEEMHQHDMKAADTEMKMPESSYPVDFCVVSKEKLGSMGDPIKYMHEGREVQFCCGGCIASFEKDPAKYLAELDNAIIETQSKNYPLNTCPVTGEELGGMGDPYNYIYNNSRLVKFCCAGCISSFEKDPDKYLKKIDAARAKAPLDEHHGHNHD